MSDRAFVAERSGVHARDLRVVGPLLSRCPSILGELMLSDFGDSCELLTTEVLVQWLVLACREVCFFFHRSILECRESYLLSVRLTLDFACFAAREKAMVINLEFIRAIVTADEVLLLEPLAQEVIPFIDKLRRHFPLKSVEVDIGATQVGNVDGNHAKTGAECGLPFESQVLELALEAVCLSFHSSLADLNRHAIFVLDELTKNVSTRNLERVRSLKSNLTSLLAGVHKVLLVIHIWSLYVS
jgi:hypothetical protein